MMTANSGVVHPASSPSACERAHRSGALSGFLYIESRSVHFWIERIKCRKSTGSLSTATSSCADGVRSGFACRMNMPAAAV